MQCSSNLWGWEEMVSDSKKNERDRWNVRRFDTRIVLEHQLDLTVSHWRIERHGSLPWANWCLLVQFSRRSCFVRYNSWICCWCRFEDAPPMFEISSLRTHVFRVWEPSKRCPEPDPKYLFDICPPKLIWGIPQSVFIFWDSTVDVLPREQQLSLHTMIWCGRNYKFIAKG